METDEISCIEHFLVIKMEQPENNQTNVTHTPDVKTKTCQTTHMQEWKNKRQSKFVICHLQCNK